MNGAVAISATGLEKWFGARKVLHGIDLEVPSGTVLSMLGPNGAGKTTIVRILSTLLAPDRGQASVEGFDVVARPAEVRRRISLTGQFAAIDDAQTGFENLYMVGRLTGLGRADARRAAGRMLGQFDLAAVGGQRASSYSGGMRRRLDLAVGLIGRPAVVFLDEPTTGLDTRSRQSVWSIVRQLVADGTTVLLTTQYLEEADQLANQLVVIDEGRVVANGTPQELKQRIGGHRLDLTMRDSDAFARLLLTLGDRALTVGDDQLVVGLATDGSATHVRHLLDQLDPSSTTVVHFAVHSTTLDEVFLALTGQSSSSREKESEGV